MGDVTASVTYTIGKKALYVTANAKAITYGDAPANDGVTYEGFIEGENESVLAGTLDYAYTYAQCGDVGTYSITPKGLTSDNYVITFVSGDLTVGTKAITVTPDDKASIYGDEATLTYVATDLVAEDTLTGVTLTRTEGNNVGTYVITATHDDAKDLNYIVTITGTATYTISQKAVTVTPDDKTITYGDDEATLTYKATGLVGEETLTGITLTREEGNNVGTYVITATHDDTLDLNYAVTITDTATYTIGQKAVTVTPDDKTITYGDDDVALTYAITGLVGEETLTGVTLTREEGTDAGTYAITATHDDTLDLNYAVTIAGTGVYTIQKKANTINTDNVVKEYTYNGSNFTVDGATALGDGDISYENNVLKEAGSYTVIVKVAEGTNYLAAETTVVVAVKETAPVKNDESGTSTHGKIISVENAQAGTSMTEIFKNAKEDESENTEIKAVIGSTIVVFDKVAIEEISTADEVKLMLNVTYVEEAQAITTENFKDAEVIINVSLSNGVTFASGKATITLEYDKEIPEGHILKVYYVDQNGNRTDMNATFADGKVTFETDHFSDYIIVMEDVSFDVGWIAFIFAMLVLAYFAAFIVLTKVFGKDGKLLRFIGLIAGAAVILAAIIILAVQPGAISLISFFLCIAATICFILYESGKGAQSGGKKNK